MPRCGCGTPSNTFLSGGDCLSLSGAGSEADPYEIAPIIDPSADNALSCGSNGLLVQEIDTFEGTNDAWTVAVTYDVVSSFTLPAGTWLIIGKGYFDFATGTTRNYELQLFDSTAAAELDHSQGQHTSSGQIPITVIDTVTLAVSSVIQLRVKTSAVDGTQLFQNTKLEAIRAHNLGG